MSVNLTHSGNTLPLGSNNLPEGNSRRRSFFFLFFTREHTIRATLRNYAITASTKRARGQAFSLFPCYPANVSGVWAAAHKFSLNDSGGRENEPVTARDPQALGRYNASEIKRRFDRHRRTRIRHCSLAPRRLIDDQMPREPGNLHPPMKHL